VKLSQAFNVKERRQSSAIAFCRADFSRPWRVETRPTWGCTCFMLRDVHVEHKRYASYGRTLRCSCSVLLAACRTFGIEAFSRSGVAKFDPSEDSFCRICRLIAVAMNQKDGKKWTAAVGLQPMYPKSDSLLGVFQRWCCCFCLYMGLASSI